MDLQELLNNFLTVVWENEDDYYDANNPKWHIKMIDDFLETQQIINSKCNCPNESTDIYDEFGNLLGWCCLECGIIEKE